MSDIGKAVELARYYSDPGRSDAWKDHHREAIAIARALLAVMPVVEAAQAWRRERVPLDDVGKRLAAAVDKLGGGR